MIETGGCRSFKLKNIYIYNMEFEANICSLAINEALRIFIAYLIDSFLAFFIFLFLYDNVIAIRY